MGKKKRLFPVGTLRLHCPSKAIATKTYSIYYVCNWNGEKIQRQTGYSCKLADWDEKNQWCYVHTDKNIVALTTLWRI